MSANQPGGLDGEIDMLRRATRRTFELFQEETLDLGSACRALAALGTAAARLAALLKAQAQVKGSDSELDALILKAIREVYMEKTSSTGGQP